jgi:hypothetical protein
LGCVTERAVHRPSGTLFKDKACAEATLTATVSARTNALLTPCLVTPLQTQSIGFPDMPASPHKMRKRDAPVTNHYYTIPFELPPGTPMSDYMSVDPFQVTSSPMYPPASTPTYLPAGIFYTDPAYALGYAMP